MERKAINQKLEVKKRLLWVKRMEESTNGIRKDISVLEEIKIGELKEKSKKRKILPRENNTEKKESAGEKTEELKRKISAKKQ